MAPANLAYIANRTGSVVNTFDSPHFTPDDSSGLISLKKTVHSIGLTSIGPEGFQFLLEGKNNEECVLITDQNGEAGVILPLISGTRILGYQVFRVAVKVFGKPLPKEKKPVKPVNQPQQGYMNQPQYPQSQFQLYPMQPNPGQQNFAQQPVYQQPGFQPQYQQPQFPPQQAYQPQQNAPVAAPAQRRLNHCK